MIYFLVIIILAFLAMIKTDKKTRNIIIIFIGIFLTTTYFNGSDWRQYEKIYYSGLDGFFEIGYQYYTDFMKILGVSDFFTFFIITKVIIFYVIFKIIRKYSQKLELYVWLFVIPTIGLFIFIDGPLRNAMALCFILFSVRYIENNKIIPYIFCVFLGSLFHSSVIIFVLIYFARFDKLKTKWLIIMFVLYNIVLLFPNIIIDIGSNIPFIETYLNNYLGTVYTKGAFLSLGNIEKIFFFFFILYNRKKIEGYKSGRLIFNLSISFIYLFRLATVFSLAGRFSFVLQVFYCISIVLIIAKYSKNIKIVFFILITVYLLLVTNQIVSNNQKYLPYTSYLEYIFKQKPSYYERANYNINYLIENGYLR